MLTLLKKTFTWWTQDTFGTRLKTIFFGKLVGSDSFGNKYYKGKSGKRWVIYSNEVDSTKIPVEWYSWMHFTPNIKLGNLNKILSNLTICISLVICSVVKSNDNFVGQYTDLKILDKISSKNELIKLINGEEFIYKDLAIKSMKCTNSEFDDNPEIKAYIQVRDLTVNDNDKVYVFNGWMFSSSPSIAPFDHAVYDIWLADCY